MENQISQSKGIEDRTDAKTPKRRHYARPFEDFPRFSKNLRDVEVAYNCVLGEAEVKVPEPTLEVDPQTAGLSKYCRQLAIVEAYQRNQ